MCKTLLRLLAVLGVLALLVLLVPSATPLAFCEEVRSACTVMVGGISHE